MKKTLAAISLLLALLALLPACGKKDNAEAVKQEIIKSLVLPPDAQLRDSKVMPEQDALVLSFGTKEKIDIIGATFKKAVAAKSFTVVGETDGGMSYRDDKGRQVSVMWFARDPDLSEFPTVFHVSVQPLPPELKTAPAK